MSFLFWKKAKVIKYIKTLSLNKKDTDNQITQVRYTKNLLDLEKKIIDLLSSSNKRLLDDLLTNQYQHYLNNQHKIYNDFIVDCLYNVKQTDFYKSSLCNNQVYFLDLSGYYNFNSLQEREKNIPKLFGTNWKRKILIESLLNVEYQISNKENNANKYLMITSTNGYHLEQGKRFFESYLNNKLYFCQQDQLTKIIHDLKQSFINDCIDLGHKILVEFLGYKKGEYDDSLALLIGKGKYKFTEKQNLLDHLCEVGSICEQIASKLNLDSLLAKRAGFFHDIGKIPTNNNSGHNQIYDGVNLANHYNLDPLIVDVIKRHHDPKDKANVYLLITKVADVLSAARPGARNHQPEFFKKSTKLIRSTLMSLDWIIKVQIHNWNQTIVVFAKTTVKDNYLIYKSMLMKSLYYQNINDYQKIFDIKIHLMDLNGNLMEKNYDQFYYDNMQKHPVN